jgi:hypothetical protein
MSCVPYYSSSVGVVTRLGIDIGGMVVGFEAGRKDFHLLLNTQPIHPSIIRVLGLFLPGRGAK